ncbi:MAG: hypothetical protein CMF38_02120 [Legionellaceae bacterium]|nr:hypothetical protein [Legionellaceae bacterium]HAF87197.1 hypothetical protein [Legionellales bacterium]HCA89088.1 hypothetical protein [Legionellales bacterium]|tara:strand:- start:10165 stop:11199 length:1035 start_codon:yes stop_codon:yes gene_type:complete
MSSTIINNAGGGHCGYYAFAIGLINIAQSKYRISSSDIMLKNWLDAGLLTEDMLQIMLKIDLNQLKRAPNQYKKQELTALQQTLRHTLAKEYLGELTEKVHHELGQFNEDLSLVEGTALGMQLHKLLNTLLAKKRISTKYNLLANSPAIINALKHLAQHIEHQSQDCATLDEKNKLTTRFLKEWLYKEVIDNQGKLLKNGLKSLEHNAWATHSDLRCLAECFQVNLMVKGKQNGETLPNRPTITLGNQNNIHWVTHIPSSKSLRNKFIFSKRHAIQSPPKIHQTDVMDEYIAQITRPGFFKSVAHAPKIDIRFIDSAEHLDNESDEDFAKRLQEAECRAAGYKV